jgi:hypothetical protein
MVPEVLAFPGTAGGAVFGIEIEHDIAVLESGKAKGSPARSEGLKLRDRLT